MIKFWMFSFVLLGHESVNANGWQCVKEYIYMCVCVCVCVCVDFLTRDTSKLIERNL